MDKLQKVLVEENIPFASFQGLSVVKVGDNGEGALIAKQLVLQLVDQKTVLFLSGGKTPNELYTALSQDETFRPGAVGMIDERYGEKFHNNSNEVLLKNAGLLHSLSLRGLPFYPILQSNAQIQMNLEDTAENYDQQVRALFSQYQKSIALVGIGTDGHTAGIIPNRTDFQNPLFTIEQKNRMVSSFNDSKSTYGQRISMTFLGLSMHDGLIMLCFGKDKQRALQLMFTNGHEEEVPARFYIRPGIAAKTVLITDQDIY